MAVIRLIAASSRKWGPVGGPPLGEGRYPLSSCCFFVSHYVSYYRLHLLVLVKMRDVLTGKPAGGSMMTWMLLSVSLSSQAVTLPPAPLLGPSIHPSNSLMPAFSSPSQPTP